MGDFNSPNPNDMKIHTQDIQNNIKVIHLDGHIDENTIGLVQDTFASIFNLSQNKIICNMKGVQHISAPVFKTFIENISTARAKGGEIKLCAVQASLQGVFRYAGFNDESVFVNDINSGVQALERDTASKNVEDPFGATIQTPSGNNVYAPTIQGKQSPLQKGSGGGVYAPTIQGKQSPLQRNQAPDDQFGATIQMSGSPLKKNQPVDDQFGATIQMSGSPLKKNQPADDQFGATIQMSGSPLKKNQPSGDIDQFGSTIQMSGSPLKKGGSDFQGNTFSLDDSPISQGSVPQTPVLDYSSENLDNDNFSNVAEEQDLSFLATGNDESEIQESMPVSFEISPEATSDTVDQTSSAQFTQSGQQDTKVFTYEITYKIADKIAEGHMGKLYKGEELSACGFSKPIALKYLKTNYSKQNYLEVLTNEIRKASAITHQNIAQVYKLVSLNNYHFVIMEYVDGVNLATMLDKLRQSSRLLPPHLACLIVYNICRSLAYANRKLDTNGEIIEIIHGEITPQNVIISKDLDIKLVGLGVSKASNMIRFQENRNFAQEFTHMPVEVKQSGIPSKSGDIFGLGVLFYELLTNQKPFTAEQINSQSNEIIFPSRINTKATDILDGLVLRCLGANPASRWKDFQDLGLQLEESLQDKGFSLTQASLKKFLEINAIF